MSDPVWPYGSGGACGEQFAANERKMTRDLAELGLVGAMEHWLATGFLSSWAQVGKLVEVEGRLVSNGGVLTEADIRKMERAT